VLLGMVQLIGNVFFRRHTGTFLSVVLVAATLVFVYTPITGKPLVKSIALLIKHSVLPCEKASFHLLSLHQNFSVITEIIFAILYYLCGVVLFTGIAYYFCRKKELDWK
jgi:general stress protein CsbA